MSRTLGGRYRLEETLGGGGTSVVFRARDLTTGDEVAVKELRPQFAAHAATRHRFAREAEVVRALSHPAIVQVLDADPGGDGRPPFLVMELVRGETLRALLARLGGIGEVAARRITATLAAALDHAHRQGVIHRDLKPENVFLVGPPAPDRDSLAGDPDLESRVKLADFGQARVMSLASLTGASAAWGTPEYMAPEAFARGRLDPRTDLYALGVLLHELITGRLPWSRTQALAQISKVGGGVAPRLPPTGADESIDELLADLLAPSPGRRPESGAAVVARLATSSSDLPEPAAACPGCGAAVDAALPLCLGCGKARQRFAHTPGAPWRLVLRHLDDDVAAVGHLQELIAAVAHPPATPVSFLAGGASFHSQQELKTHLGLPALLFADLDEGTARELERLFQSRGLDVHAGTGSGPPARITRASLGNVSSALVTVAVSAAMVTQTSGRVIAGVAIVGVSVLAGGVGMLAMRIRRRRPLPAFTLLERPVAVPVADELLANLTRTLQRIFTPEARHLLTDLIGVLYRLTWQAASGPSDLGRRISERARSVAARAAVTAERLDGIAAELDRTSDAALVQELGRLERRLAAAPEGERAALAATRRELEVALVRRHRLEHEHERLSTALCLLLGSLREIARHQRALAEDEAGALEVAAAGLESLAAP
jgi:hypothetical protein